MPFSPMFEPRSWWLTAALLAGPALFALAVLVAMTELTLGAGVVVVLAVTATVIGAIRLRGKDIARLEGYVARLQEAREDVPLPDSASGETRALAETIGSLHRSWLRQKADVEGRLRADELILETLPDPLIVVDGQRRVVRLNAAARGLFQDRSSDNDLSALIRAPHVLEATGNILAGAAATLTVEFSLAVPVERIFEVRVTPQAATHGAVLMLHDVTSARRSEQMRQDFVANASHELRTPLSTLLGFIETLRGPARDDPEARDRFLGIMYEQASRMTRLVNDLLSLSRIEQDEHTYPTGKVDLMRVIGTAVASLEMRAAQRGVILSVEILPEGLPPVLGDEDQLAQICQNLIDNAIKYTREKTAITIRLTTVEATSPGAALMKRRSGGQPLMIHMAVTDQGEGIPRTHLPRLTERFYRVDPARSRALGGTGLGLAIVKHIVKRHRGRLVIESEVGQGSTFNVYLPIAQDVSASL